MEKTKRLVAAAVAVLLAAGCASTGGIAPVARGVDPDALGAADPAAAPDGASAAEFPRADWWRTLGDPGLDALVDRALADSPTLRSAEARLVRAQSLAEAAEAALLPRVDGAVDVARQRFSRNYIYPPPLGGRVWELGTAQANIGWELDFFGRNRAAIASAAGQRRAAQADAQAARILLATSIARQYVQLARLLEQRQVAIDTRTQRSRILDLVRQRLAAGLDTRVELRQSEATLPQIAQEIEALDEQVALARNALAALAGQGPQATAALAPTLAALRARPLPAALPADLLGRRADLVAARWRVEAAARDVDVARTQFHPNVNLVAFVGVASLGLSSARVFDREAANWSVGPAIRLPIFEARRLRANLAGRTADYDAAVESWNQALTDAVREVADQVASSRSLKRQAAEQRAAQALAEDALALSTVRYGAGLGTFLNVLTAETAVLAQRRLGVDLRARALDANLLLARALGGGFEAPPDMPAGPPPAPRALDPMDAGRTR